MSSKNYAKGVRAEKKSRRYLEAQGFYVIEARGSHGSVDLVGTSLGGVVLVQVKSGRKESRAEFAASRQKLRDVPVPDGPDRYVWREMHHWENYSRSPIVEIV